MNNILNRNIYTCAIVGMILLCACMRNSELIDMSTVESDGYRAILWEGRKYVPFCPVSKSDCKKQIGYLDGNTDEMVLEYKDYPNENWIVSCIKYDCGALLLKEVSVVDIPDGLESEYLWNK